MYSSDHSLNSLFLQIGLDDSDAAIDQFINSHKPLPQDVLLHEADLWSHSQAAFLQQAVEEDADWAIVVDQLNSMLR